ncbi:hypothetical protein LCGC14_0981670 [marine sediment metagenome]|uniref:Uncharacterized protein n=1 Tax=marine sediment metagenome TaxID=412755 RepID=A0A0F9ND10_9ZZZZ
MTTDEALQILDQAASAAPLNRQTHIAVQEAVTTLRVALTAKNEEAFVPMAGEEPSRDGAVPEKA